MPTGCVFAVHKISLPAIIPGVMSTQQPEERLRILCLKLERATCHRLSLFATSYPGLVIVGAQGLSRAFIDAGLWRRSKEHRRKRPTEGRPSRTQRRHGDSAYQTYSVTRSPPEGNDLRKRRKGVCRRAEIMSLKHTDPLSNVVRGPI